MLALSLARLSPQRLLPWRWPLWLRLLALLVLLALAVHHLDAWLDRTLVRLEGVAEQATWQAQKNAPLTVVDDNGLGVPIGVYQAHLVAQAPGADVMAGLSFPLQTALRREVLRADEVELMQPTWLTRPFVILGSDSASLKWGRHNLPTLQAIDAVVLVIEAPTPEAFRAVQGALEGLTVVPYRSQWLEQLLASRAAAVYPLLVQTNGRARQVLPAFGSAGPVASGGAP